MSISKHGSDFLIEWQKEVSFRCLVVQYLTNPILHLTSQVTNLHPSHPKYLLLPFPLKGHDLVPIPLLQCPWFTSMYDNLPEKILHSLIFLLINKSCDFHEFINVFLIAWPLFDRVHMAASRLVPSVIKEASHLFPMGREWQFKIHANWLIQR